MTLKKLLLAASITAISATSAQAVTVTATLLDSTAVPVAVPVTPAIELEFPALATPSTDLEVSIFTTSGDFPAGNNLLVTVNLPSGVSFSEAVIGGDFESRSGGTATITQASAIVQNMSGQVNGSSVDFLISIPQGANIDELAFDLDVKLDECVVGTVVNANATVTTEQGTAIENGGATALVSTVNPCADGISLSAQDDEAPAGATLAATDTLITLASNFENVNDNTIGFVNGVINPGVSRNLAGEAIDVSDLDSATFDVVFEDDAGLASVTILGQTSTIINDVASFSFTAAGDLTTLFDGDSDAITLTVSGTGDQIITQQVSVENLVIDFNDSNAEFQPTEAQADGNIDFLQREGQTFGVFDWNGGAGTASIYRVTGLSQTTDTPYTITFSNSNVAGAPGANVDGTYSGMISSSDMVDSNGEAVLNSISGFGLDFPPTFRRADILINFETSDAIDVDRLLARGGIVTAFGDGSNANGMNGTQPDGADGDTASE